MEGGVGPSEEDGGVVVVEGRGEVHHCSAQVIHSDRGHHQLGLLGREGLIDWLTG